jgi:hypothetical protein
MVSHVHMCGAGVCTPSVHMYVYICAYNVHNSLCLSLSLFLWIRSLSLLQEESGSWYLPYSLGGTEGTLAGVDLIGG